MDDKPRIGIFTMGGTIASTSSALPLPPELGTAKRGVVPRLTAGHLVAAVPGLDSHAELELHDVRQKPSASLVFDDVYAVLAQIEARTGTRVAGRPDGPPELTGAVVTQGTDPIEESSWLLDLLYDGPAPVVVTGAMRTPATPGADGPANLLAAVQVAASPQARDLGVLVVLNDEIHSARTVRKAHSTSPAAFSSPDTGPIGRVIEGTVTIFNQPSRACLHLPARDRVPRVAVVSMAFGEDDAVLRAVAGQVDGIVLTGFGAGNAPTQVVAALTELAPRMPVVLATRTAAGPVTTSTYGYPGSGSDLLSRGLISAGYLSPYKARILLHLLLAASSEPGTIAGVFAHLGSTPLSTPVSGSRAVQVSNQTRSGNAIVSTKP